MHNVKHLHKRKTSILTSIASVVQKGKVYYDKNTLLAYSVDAGSYQIIPLVVAIPKSLSELTRIVRFASKNKIPITTRGAGTGLVGSAIGSGIIIDMKNFDKIKVGKTFVNVSSGVTKGKLDCELYKINRLFAPNPSIGPYCTIGGMIATNASGSHSLKYGSTIDNILEITFVTSKGEIVTLPKNRQISKKIHRIVSNTKNTQNFPNVTKNSSGYRIDSVHNWRDSFKVLAGSEGTLGIITSAKLKTRQIPERKILFVLKYSHISDAAKECYDIAKLGPSALELVGSKIARQIATTGPDGCLLYVEFDCITKARPFSYWRRLVKHHAKNNTILKTTGKKSDIEKWWKTRDSSLAFSIKNIKKNNSHLMPTIIEDASVPLERLPELTDFVKKLSKKYSFDYILYGHAGNGNLHIRPALKRDGKEGKTKIKKIAREFFTYVWELGGSISGEHGDGLARSAFVKRQYKKQTYTVFESLKRELDSSKLFNPGKIITDNKDISRHLARSNY